MMAEQVRQPAHECQDGKIAGICPGYEVTRERLVARVCYHGCNPSAADDIANSCFESALWAREAGEAIQAIRCLCAYASHYRRFRWAVLDAAEARDTEQT
jgi:hypothetical protein